VEPAAFSGALDVKRCCGSEARDVAPADASMIDLIARPPVGEAGVRTVAPGFEPGVGEVFPIL
jgi:hypothetical protein